ncbi:MAG: T9SS type A sorting domain-containing protein, partial [Bacteroidota bacterium]
ARFAVVQQVVSESQPSVELTVELDRNPDADTDFSVVLTEGDPADIGGFTSETVTAGASGASAFTVTVPITDDALSEADERFVFAISADASELRLGSPSQTVVLIVDNDGEARTVSVPLRDRDADGEEDAGPRFFALPINTSASTIADAAGADSVYVVAADGALAALDPSDLVPAGRPVLVDVEEGADLTIAGTVPAGLVTYPAGRIGADPEARLLVGVGNAIDDPVDLEAIDIAGGTLADVALVFDDARGAFRPVSLPRLSDPKTLAPFDAVVVQVVPDNAAADVSVTVVPAPLVSAPGTEVDEAPFGPAADESGAVLTLQPVGADGPGDVAALRFDVGGIPGLDGLDAYDLVSPLGGTLAATATSDATTLAQAPLAAYAESQLAAGQAVTVPLVVIVPEMGTYEIAAPEIFQGSISDRPVVVEILDNSIATTLTDGDTATFVAGSGDAGDPGAFAGRFAVRVSLGAAVSEEGGPDVAGLRVFPNPSAGVAAVQVTPAEAGPARVAVYDALGRQVAVLHDGPLPAGTTRLSSGALSPGLYVVRVDGPGLAETRQLTVVR